MKMAVQYCEESLVDDIITMLPDAHVDNGIWQTIKEIALDQNETFVFCRIFDRKDDCEKLFRPVVTEAGLCYTFNSLNMNEMITNE